jgi:hypothetical protein
MIERTKERHATPQAPFFPSNDNKSAQRTRKAPSPSPSQNVKRVMGVEGRVAAEEGFKLE